MSLRRETTQPTTSRLVQQTPAARARPVYPSRVPSDPSDVTSRDRPAPSLGGASVELVERDEESQFLERAVARLEDRVGGLVTLRAAAGLGKTTLIERAAVNAEAAGHLVRVAAPGPQERHFPYGVVRSLLEAPLRDAAPAERLRLLDGAAGQAGELLLSGAVPGPHATTSIAHSTLWLCSALTDDAPPLVLVVDDAHWADRPSLEVLSYLARRIGDLPLLLVVAYRPDVPDAASDLLALLEDSRTGSVLGPRPLTVEGAAELVRRIAPDTPTELCRRCHEAGEGNPWLVAELAHQLSAYGPDALKVPVGDSLEVRARARDVVRRRVAALTAVERAVAVALAVLGDRALPHVTAAVAGVPLTDLAAAHDALAAAGLLDRDRRALAHALIATAILEDRGYAETTRLHREAARALQIAGAPTDVVAGHLLHTAPQHDDEVAAILRDAVSASLARGSPHAAAAYLRRAIVEHAPSDDRGQLLAQLATTTFDAGLPGARESLRAALAHIRDPTTRVEFLTRLATWFVLDAGDHELSDLLERELADTDSAELRLALEVAALEMLIMIPERHAERAHRIAMLHDNGTADPTLTRSALAHRAWLATELGTPDSDTCAALACRALDGGLLLDDVGSRAGFHCCVRALVFTDRFADAQLAIDAMRKSDAVRGSLRLRAGASWYAAELAQRTGRVADAENEARLVLDLTADDVNLFTGGAIEILIWALAERGAFVEAHALLDEHDLQGEIGDAIWEIGIVHSRAVLALAEGDFPRAHQEALHAGRMRVNQGRPNPVWTPWRATAALALAHEGHHVDAGALAAEELALAERFGAPAAIFTAMHAAIVAEDDDTARLARCEAALERPIDAPTLELSRIRIELGRTLSRLGRRIEARESLQHVLADADHSGATVLADRARRELVATGLRPRRAHTSGIASLTPRQRQVGELAAAGAPNRLIAQQLFLSVKTVETHLAAVYDKLGVESRAGLTAVLTSRADVPAA
jgi:DNA-binding CsgD family transcriptional regulator